MDDYQAAEEVGCSQMKRNAKIIISVVVILTLVVTVLALINHVNISEKRAARGSGAFLITVGDRRYAVMFEDIEAITPRTIDANYKTNLMPPVQKKYTGVSLKSVFSHLGVDYSAAKRVKFTGEDGYASTISITEALGEDNCFIVFEEERKPLGTRESGGYGPYMMILAKDKVSQRWCKFLLEVEII